MCEEVCDVAETESRIDTGDGRAKNGQFVKGVSGNPKGKPKKPTALKRLAKQSLDELWAIASDKATPVRVRADIYKWIYEWHYGKAVQAVTGEDGGAAVVRVVMDATAEEYAG